MSVQSEIGAGNTDMLAHTTCLMDIKKTAVIVRTLAIYGFF
jgi:hypothetical protein